MLFRPEFVYLTLRVQGDSSKNPALFKVDEVGEGIDNGIHA
jgi:hypothetical protein